MNKNVSFKIIYKISKIAHFKMILKKINNNKDIYINWLTAAELAMKNWFLKS